MGDDEKESARNAPVETGTDVVKDATGKHGMAEGRCPNNSTGAGVDDASEEAEIGEKIEGVNVWRRTLPRICSGVRRTQKPAS